MDLVGDGVISTGPNHHFSSQVDKKQTDKKNIDTAPYTIKVRTPQVLQADQDSFCPGAEVQGVSVGRLFFAAR